MSLTRDDLNSIIRLSKSLESTMERKLIIPLKFLPTTELTSYLKAKPPYVLKDMENMVRNVDIESEVKVPMYNSFIRMKAKISDEIQNLMGLALDNQLRRGTVNFFIETLREIGYSYLHSLENMNFDIARQINS